MLLLLLAQLLDNVCQWGDGGGKVTTATRLRIGRGWRLWRRFTCGRGWWRRLLFSRRRREQGWRWPQMLLLAHLIFWRQMLLLQ